MEKTLFLIFLRMITVRPAEKQRASSVKSLALSRTTGFG